jgi:hypothetical protein
VRSVSIFEGGRRRNCGLIAEEEKFKECHPMLLVITFIFTHIYIYIYIYTGRLATCITTALPLPYHHQAMKRLLSSFSFLLPLVGLTAAVTQTSTPHVWSTPQGGNYQGVLSAHTGECVYICVCDNVYVYVWFVDVGGDFFVADFCLCVQACCT